MRKLFFAGCGLLVVGMLAAHFRDYIVEPTFSEDARHWSTIPLKVTHSPDLKWANEAFNTAIKDFNDRVGCRVLQHNSENPDAYVFTMGERKPCGQEFTDPGAGTYACKSGPWDIMVHNLTETREIHVAFKHEFGHLFGLVHDPYGLMAKGIRRSDWADPHRPIVTLSTKDAKWIRDWYCD
jgi:hypothetical protein